MQFLENRIPPPLVMALCMLAAWLFDSTPTDIIWVQAVSAACVIVGVWLARLSIGRFLRSDTTVNPLRPEAASALVTDGIFGYSRNPMYLALALGVFAFSLYFSGYWSILFTAAFVAYINRFQIDAEEKALEGLFGQEYIDYKTNVRRWF